MPGAFCGLDDAIRGPSNKVTGRIFYPLRSRIVEEFENIVICELRPNGTIENERSQCNCEEICLSYFRKLDEVRHQRVLVRW